MGLSLNYWTARNSFLVIICDETNQSLVYGYFTTSRSLGLILGQAIGGDNFALFILINPRLEIQTPGGVF